MDNKTLVEKAIEISEKYNTVYAKGMIGDVIFQSSLDFKKNQYPSWYTNIKINDLSKHIGEWGFDCVCLIKSILWGWIGDRNKSHGGAIYLSNGVPDVTTEGMLEKCYDVSEDFSNIDVGEYLWLQGHAGIYIGDGLAVECTNKSGWKNGVQITAVHNIGKIAGYNGRYWTKHGKLPWVEYGESEETMKELKKGDKGSMVESLQSLLVYHGIFDIDGSFGSITEAGVKSFQSKNGLSVTGKVDQKTWDKLLGVE